MSELTCIHCDGDGPCEACWGEYAAWAEEFGRQLAAEAARERAAECGPGREPFPAVAGPDEIPF